MGEITPVLTHLMHAYILQWISLGYVKEFLNKLLKKGIFFFNCKIAQHWVFLKIILEKNIYFSFFENARIFLIWLQCFKTWQQTHIYLALINYGEGKFNFLTVFPMYTRAPWVRGNLRSCSGEAFNYTHSTSTDLPARGAERELLEAGWGKVPQGSFYS